MTRSSLPHRPPRSPHLPARPLRRHRPSEPGGIEQRNRRWLAAYAHSEENAVRLHWRNRLVEANLGLVHSVAARFAPTSRVPYGDLVQVGCQGLIRAVEAFDGRRARCLSTFAVPYVRGAIQHELRDREAWIRPPRRLWELRQRALGVQEARRAKGRPPLSRQALAAALACPPEDLAEVETLREAGLPLSLDALQCRGEADGSGSWLEQLPDPRSLPGEDGTRLDPHSRAQLIWLRGQLGELEALQRELVVGRVGVGCSWVELGQRFGLHPRMAERRCKAALQQLQASAQQWQPPESLRCAGP